MIVVAAFAAGVVAGVAGLAALIAAATNPEHD